MGLKKVTNVSNIHLGTAKPLSLFLRRPEKNKKNEQSSAVVKEEDIDAKMYLWEKKGFLLIEDLTDEDDQEEVAEAAPEPAVKVADPTPTAKVPTVSSGEGGDLVVEDKPEEDDDDGVADAPFATAEDGAPAPKHYTRDDLNKMPVKKIRQLVKDLGIKTKSKKKKDIIEAIGDQIADKWE